MRRVSHPRHPQVSIRSARHGAPATPGSPFQFVSLLSDHGPRTASGDAERRLNDAGIPLEEEEFGIDGVVEMVDPEVAGCILAEYVEGGVRFKAAIRAGLAGPVRETFAEWAGQRFQRFAEYGPEPDGWQERTDEAWQLWGRLVEMPRLD